MTTSNATPTPADQPAPGARPTGATPRRSMTVPGASAPADMDMAALDAEIARQQQQEIREQQLQRWHASLPEKFRHATTDHPDVKKKVEQVAAGRAATAGMVITGTVGEGKTWMAIAYANELIERNLLQPNQVLFGTESELLASAANAGFGEVEQRLKALTSRRTKMLIVDDVGRGTWLREDMRSKVFSLVFDAAWRDNKIVVVTTNLPKDKLEEEIGSGAMDRLRSMVDYKSTVLTDRGMRRRTTQEMSTDRRSAP